MPPSRLPGPPAPSGAALMALTGMAVCPMGGTAGPPVQATGTDNLPAMDVAPAPPIAAAEQTTQATQARQRLGRR